MLNSIRRVRSGAKEDALWTGFVMEEALEAKLLNGDLPDMTSVILDMNSVLQPQQWLLLNKVQSLKLTNESPNVTINVVPGRDILEPCTNLLYYMSTFPTLFPLGTGKHIDERRGDNKLSLKGWRQLLLRRSSR